jgi:hypothetical protein
MYAVQAWNDVVLVETLRQAVTYADGCNDGCPIGTAHIFKLKNDSFHFTDLWPKASVVTYRARIARLKVKHDAESKRFWDSQRKKAAKKSRKAG